MACHVAVSQVSLLVALLPQVTLRLRPPSALLGSRGPRPQKGTARVESFWALVVKSWEAQPDGCVALGESGTISELLSPSSPANLVRIA